MRLQKAQGPAQGTDAVLIFDRENLRFTPGQKATIAHAEYVTHASIDGYGYRNPCPIDSPARILLVGDSFVFGIGVDDAGTLQCILTNSVPTYAMGITGAGPIEYKRMIERQFRFLVDRGLVSKDARVVVVLFLGNDFEDLLDESHARAQSAPRSHKRTGDTPPGEFLQRANDLVFREWPTKNSHLLNLIKMAIVRQSSRISESADFLRLIITRDPRCIVPGHLSGAGRNSLSASRGIFVT